MQRALRLLLCAAALLWARPASADDVYFVYVGLGGNQLEQRARSYLEDRLNLLSNWMDNPARVRGYPRFAVRPIPRTGRAPLQDRRTVAIVSGIIVGQEQNEPSATVDISSLTDLSVLEIPANQFAPVRGIIHTGVRGDLSTNMRMYEAIIQYGLLVRAFETSQRTAFGLLLSRLSITIHDARHELGSTTVSFRCLRVIEANAVRMRDRFSAPRAPAHPGLLPAKNLAC